METDYIPLTAVTVRRIREAAAGARVIVDRDLLEPYGKDATLLFALPELVVEVTTTEQIQAILHLARELNFPVTPRGLGTGLAGGAVPLRGGVVLSLARMNRIIAIEPENMIAVVEPGCVNQDLKEAAKAAGLFYPPDPASLDTCSLGGNAATNAGGPACLKYGTTRDYILGVEAVLPSGERIRTGVRTRKGVVGYDLTRLLVGSEGTLGIITELTLKLIPRPEAVTTLVALFPDLSLAMKTIHTILMRGYIPCAMEFMDRRCLDLVGDLLPFSGVQGAAAFLMVETDGPWDLIQRESEAIGRICLDQGATNCLLAPDAGKRARMWEARRQVALRIEETAPVYIPEDICIPISRIAAFVAALPDLEQAHDIALFAFGHAGDGNIHLIITAAADHDEGRVQAAVEQILKRTLAMGGTISGEHGIGAAKMPFLPWELSPVSIRLQKEIKNLFDPHQILNPGKLFL